MLTTASAYLWATVMAVAGFAQKPPAFDTGADSGALDAKLVKTGLYLISGGGCNTLLRLSANGLIVVDGKVPGNYDALLAQLKRISDQPVRVLINTDHHVEHTGNNAKFLEAGTEILAHENLKNNLTGYNPQGGKIASPTRTYNQAFALRLGGVEAQVIHFGNAHTNADTVVYFPNLRVVAVGDLLAPTPNPDFSAGGSLMGWGPVLDQILKLDFDVVVPGMGPIATRADLEVFKNKMGIVVSRAAALVKKGLPRDRLMAQLTTDELGWRISLTEDQLDGFYAELSQTK